MHDAPVAASMPPNTRSRVAVALLLLRMLPPHLGERDGGVGLELEISHGDRGVDDDGDVQGALWRRGD
jgi:hypothetical protein